MNPALFTNLFIQVLRLVIHKFEILSNIQYKLDYRGELVTLPHEKIQNELKKDIWNHLQQLKEVLHKV